MANIREKLLLFGGLPEKYLEDWGITQDLDLAAKKLGVCFQAITTDEVICKYKAMDKSKESEACHMATALLEGQSRQRKRTVPPAPPLSELIKAAGLCCAMRSFVDEHKAQGVTIVCRSWILNQELPVPCIALMLLQEEGVPAACQGDTDAFLTMVLVKRVTDLTSFMGGGIKARGQFGVNHWVVACGNHVKKISKLAQAINIKVIEL